MAAWRGLEDPSSAPGSAFHLLAGNFQPYFHFPASEKRGFRGKGLAIALTLSQRLYLFAEVFSDLPGFFSLSSSALLSLGDHRS